MILCTLYFWYWGSQFLWFFFSSKSSDVACQRSYLSLQFHSCLVVAVLAAQFLHRSCPSHSMCASGFLLLSFLGIWTATFSWILTWKIRYLLDNTLTLEDFPSVSSVLTDSFLCCALSYVLGLSRSFDEKASMSYFSSQRLQHFDFVGFFSILWTIIVNVILTLTLKNRIY